MYMAKFQPGSLGETSERLENQCGNAVHSAFACAVPML